MRCRVQVDVRVCGRRVTGTILVHVRSLGQHLILLAPSYSTICSSNMLLTCLAVLLQRNKACNISLQPCNILLHHITSIACQGVEACSRSRFRGGLCRWSKCGAGGRTRRRLVCSWRHKGRVLLPAQDKTCLDQDKTCPLAGTNHHPLPNRDKKAIQG